MEVSALHYLVAIAREGSLTRAAAAVRVSQPTLSVAMRSLEEELATQLLVRHRSGVRLTPAGQELLRCAHNVLAMLEEARQRVHDVQTGDRGAFVLGCNPSLGGYFLPGFLGPFLNAQPGIELTLWNASSALVRQAVLDRSVHFALVVNTVPHPDLVITEAFRDHIEVVESTARPAAGSLQEAAQRFAERRLLSADLPAIVAFANKLAADGLVAGSSLTCGTLELVKALVQADVGLALLPRRVALHGNPHALRSLHPELPVYSDRIHLVYRADLPRTRAAAILKAAILDHGTELGDH